MSIHYLLDGYNVIHQMPLALDQTKLEDQRWCLVRFIEQYRPQGSINNPVTVVFDGSVDVFGGMKSSVAKILFSQGESADDMIKEIVGQAKNTKDIVVVSDDRDIQYAVRALGARISGTRAFIDKAKVSKKMDTHKVARPAKKGSVKDSSSEQEKYILKSDEFKITSEFSRIWLDPKRKRKK